jgi:hypothetical protein
MRTSGCRSWWRFSVLRSWWSSDEYESRIAGSRAAESGLPPSAGSDLRPGGGGMAGRGRGADQAGQCRFLSLSDFVGDGGRRICGAVDRSFDAEGHGLYRFGYSREAASGSVGAAGRHTLGGGQHPDGFRREERRHRGGVSAVEHQQPGGPVVGLAAFRRIAWCGRGAMGEGAGRRRGDCRRHLPPGVRHHGAGAPAVRTRPPRASWPRWAPACCGEPCTFRTARRTSAV